MAEDVIGLAIGLTPGLVFAIWLWRRRGAPQLSATWSTAIPEEPCWTEEVLRGPDGLSYGRYGCFHADLADMDKREFISPG